MSKNVSDQVVEMLVQAGVKRVYAITGDSLNPVNDAIRRDGRLEWIHVRSLCSLYGCRTQWHRLLYGKFRPRTCASDQWAL